MLFKTTEEFRDYVIHTLGGDDKYDVVVTEGVYPRSTFLAFITCGLWTKYEVRYALIVQERAKMPIFGTDPNCWCKAGRLSLDKLWCEWNDSLYMQNAESNILMYTSAEEMKENETES